MLLLLLVPALLTPVLSTALVYLSIRTCDIFLFVSLARAEIWLLFNGLLALLFHVIPEFDRFLQRGCAQK